MTAPVALSPAAHARTRVITTPGDRFGDNVGVVGVVPAEFGSLLATYPLFLRKNGRTGQFEPCAVLGFGTCENLFLHDETWDAAYVPLQRLTQPFTLVPGEGSAGPALAIDPASPRVSDSEGEILFLENGEPSSYLTRIEAMIAALRSGSKVAHAYAAHLEALDLIELVRVEVGFIDGTSATLDGLYAIRADGLRQLRDGALGDLHARGYLELAWYQIASLVQMQALIARKNKRLLEGAQ